MTLTGSLTNRILENQENDKEIKVGMDVTELLYTDRNCFYVTKVDSQKHIYVKRYYVCGDQDKAGGMGHQDWLYFKTKKEQDNYIKNYFPDHTINSDPEKEYDEEWVYRYNNWYEVEHDYVGKKHYHLKKLNFGTRSYYYDWEF